MNRVLQRIVRTLGGAASDAAVGPPLRGRVYRVSIVQGGEVSVVLRFGGEETGARNLNQGTLVELRELAGPPPPLQDGD